jgi:ABC-type Mn2+/Zn2+ transport system ATPase subunit
MAKRLYILGVGRTTWETLVLHRPAIVAITGSNGAGKTIFFHSQL